MARWEIKSFALLGAFISLTCVTAKTLPSWLQTRCKLSESQCISDRVTEYGTTFAKGIPELGVEPLDPMKLRDVHIANPGFEMSFKQGVLTGLRNFKLNHFKMSPDGKKLDINLFANLTMKCQYKIDGQLLILPIKGEGASKIRLKDLNIIVKADLDDIIKDGVTYHTITTYKQEYKVAHATFKMEGLFGENNQLLADTTLKFLNDNWEPFIYDLAKPFVSAIIDQVITQIKAFMSAVPNEELFLQ